VVPEKAVQMLPGTFGPRVKVPAAARRGDRGYSIGEFIGSCVARIGVYLTCTSGYFIFLLYRSKIFVTILIQILEAYKYCILGIVR
jgi:hypothetical protein